MVGSVNNPPLGIDFAFVCLVSFFLTFRFNFSLTLLSVSDKKKLIKLYVFFTALLVKFFFRHAQQDQAVYRIEKK